MGRQLNKQQYGNTLFQIPFISICLHLNSILYSIVTSKYTYKILILFMTMAMAIVNNSSSD